MIPAPLVHNLGKYFALKKAFFLAALEDVHGDYLEFGVFTGSSFACAVQSAGKFNTMKRQTVMKFYGFDSFEGFGEVSEEDEHPFYQDNIFVTNKDRVEKRIGKLVKKNQSFKLIPGFFDKTLDNVEPNSYGIGKVAIALIDCDTKIASESCFRFITPILQEGSILLLDDFYAYKGHSGKGLQDAFYRWAENLDGFKFRRISSYGIGGAVFIAHHGDRSDA